MSHLLRNAIALAMSAFAGAAASRGRGAHVAIERSAPPELAPQTAPPPHTPRHMRLIPDHPSPLIDAPTRLDAAAIAMTARMQSPDEHGADAPAATDAPERRDETVVHAFGPDLSRPLSRGVGFRAEPRTSPAMTVVRRGAEPIEPSAPVATPAYPTLVQRLGTHVRQTEPAETDDLETPSPENTAHPTALDPVLDEGDMPHLEEQILPESEERTELGAEADSADLTDPEGLDDHQQNDRVEDTGDGSMAAIMSVAKRKKSKKSKKAVKKTGAVSGTITNSYGRGLRLMYVGVYDKRQQLVHFAFTGTGGAYTIDGLAAGKYRLAAFDDLDDDYEKVWIGGEDFDDAQPIKVKAGDEICDLDAALRSGASVSTTLHTDRKKKRATINIEAIDRATGAPAHGKIKLSSGSYKQTVRLTGGSATVTLGPVKGKKKKALKLEKHLNVDYVGTAHTEAASTRLKLK